MSAQVASRLSPEDFYHRLDRLRANWHGDVANLTEPDSSKGRYDDTRRQAALDLHERKIAAQLVTLRRLIEKLPPRFYERAIREYDTLTRARLSESGDWLGAMMNLRRTVGDWDKSRPPLVDCPECGIQARGQDALRLHRYLLHDIEEN